MAKIFESVRGIREKSFQLSLVARSMVSLGKGREREEGMEVGQERSRPLHNFKMPSLKWGNQKFLRCINLNPNGDQVERKESLMKPPSPPAVADVGGSLRGLKAVDSKGDDGIDAVRANLMFDLQAAADKIKDPILREGLEEEEEEEEELLPEEADDAVRPWNLRTRRAACKAPNGVTGGSGRTVNGGVGKIDVWRPNFSPLRNKSKSLTSGGDFTGERKERQRFSVSLSRREIEEDIMEMTGRKPHRRPRKRPKIVQKELDNLFPGLWLTEVTADMYKVPETGKR